MKRSSSLLRALLAAIGATSLAVACGGKVVREGDYGGGADEGNASPTSESDPTSDAGAIPCRSNSDCPGQSSFDDGYSCWGQLGTLRTLRLWLQSSGCVHDGFRVRRRVRLSRGPLHPRQLPDAGRGRQRARLHDAMHDRQPVRTDGQVRGRGALPAPNMRRVSLLLLVRKRSLRHPELLVGHGVPRGLLRLWELRGLAGQLPA
jgi:hypothetical protein